MAAIMVVEDQDDIRELMSMLLQLEGHQPSAVEDGDVALERLRAGAVCDLIVTDMHMTRMHGDVLAQTLAEDPHFAHIPVIILSGDYASHLPPNVVAQIAKPLDVTELLQKIQQTLAPNAA
ncbi:MAG: response regulator [Herpetosiphonaceae bacterium]|nr:response regulator [Herpetosiphonaceae bacterium]